MKWAGGKGQLIHEIERYYPFETIGIKKYAEPFVGGDAVLFNILSRFDLDSVFISDVNKDLINAYCIIKDELDALLEKLYCRQNEYLPMTEEDRKAYYLQAREEFNALAVGKEKKINIEKAALLIFLNKTCFNGLFRVNKKGLFNVPMGGYKKPLICDEKNLTLISKKLQNVEIVYGDYMESVNFADKDTFVYFDPPYRPIATTSAFTAYTSNLFDDEQQIKLARFVDVMHQKGVKFLVSNSDPKNTNPDDDFFDKLYAAYNIKRVEASRMINSNGKARGKIKELLISNF